MVLPQPHPRALFSLVAANEKTRDVINHPNNRHLLSPLPGEEDFQYPSDVAKGLNVGFEFGPARRCANIKIDQDCQLRICKRICIKEKKEKKE